MSDRALEHMDWVPHALARMDRERRAKEDAADQAGDRALKYADLEAERDRYREAPQTIVDLEEANSAESWEAAYALAREALEDA